MPLQRETDADTARELVTYLIGYPPTLDEFENLRVKLRQLVFGRGDGTISWPMKIQYRKLVSAAATWGVAVASFSTESRKTGSKEG